MRHLRWWSLVVLLMLGAATASAQTSPTPPPQIAIALDDLAARLERTLTLDTLANWTFAQDVYSDFNLGCNFVASSPAAAPFAAYTFTFDLGNGEIYTYKVSEGGDIVIPCDESLLATPDPSATEEVVITACPPNFDGTLVSRLAPNTQAQVDPANDANRLRSAPATTAEQTGVINPGRVIDVLRGPSCSEDGIVWWEVAIDGQVGWTAEGVAPDDYYLIPVARDDSPNLSLLDPTQPPVATLAPVAVGTPLPLVDAASPDASRIAYVRTTPDGAPTLAIAQFAADGTLQESASLSLPAVENFALSVQHIEWSADASRLAYTTLDDEGTTNVWLTSAQGNAPLIVASGLAAGFPVAFTPDSQQLVYLRETRDAEPAGFDVAYDVIALNLSGDATESVLATVTHQVGCGGGVGYPGDIVYNSETGFGGRALTLEVTDYGVLYSTACSGAGTALLDLESGESVAIGTQMSRARVSPDGARVAGTNEAQDATGTPVLTVVDLATRAQSPLGTVAAPDQIAWGTDGVLYYSTRTVTDTVIPGSDAGGEALAAALIPAEGVPAMTISIHRVDLNAQTDTAIYSASHYGVGRMFSSADENGLYFSAIPSGEAWLAGLQSGDVAADLPIDDAAAAYFAPRLFRINADGSNLTLVADGVNLATATKSG